MPAYTNALEGLRKAALLRPEETTQPGLGPGASLQPRDPSLLNHLFNQRLGREYEDRLMAATRAGAPPEELQGLNLGYQRTTRDLRESPLTAQAAEVADLEKRGKAAQLAGFLGINQGGGYGGAIAEQAGHERSLAEEQMRQPLTIAREKEAGESQRATQKLAHEEMEGFYTRDHARDLQREYLDRFGGGGGVGADGRPISRFTLPGPRGGGSVSYGAEAGASPSTLSGIARFKGQMEFARERYGEDHPEFLGAQASYSQALQNAFAQLPGDPDIKSSAMEIAGDRGLEGLSMFEMFDPSTGTLHPRLQELGYDFSEITPEELAQLDRLIRIARGQ